MFKMALDALQFTFFVYIRSTKLNLMRRLAIIPMLVLAFSCHKDENFSDSVPYSKEVNPVISGDISNKKVNAIAEDAQGHIWIGTFRGLNKYNKHEYHQYFSADDSLSLPDNQIKDLYLDSESRLWVATVNGVAMYTDRDDFHNIPLKHVYNRNVHQILESRGGRIFFNTINELYSYNEETNSIEIIMRNLDGMTMNSRCHIDSNDRLWVSTPLHLKCYDPEDMRLQDSISVKNYPSYSYLHDGHELWMTGNRSLALYDTNTHRFKEVPASIQKLGGVTDITLIHPYGENGLLLNTLTKGMFYYDSSAGTVVQQGENGFPFDVPAFKITEMFTDSQQNLWIGSIDQGYEVKYHYKERFNINDYLRMQLQNKSVTAIDSDENKNLFIATLSGELYVYNVHDSMVRQIDISGIIPQEEKKAVYVNQLMVDADGFLWMMATRNELLKCRYVDGRIHVEKRYQMWLPMSITQDMNKTIWVGSAMQWIYALEYGDEEFRPILVFDSGYSFIPGLLPMSDGKLLVAGFNQPLKTVDLITGEVGNLPVSEDDYMLCIPRSVMIPTALHEDKAGNVWIGTVTNGLLCYDMDEGSLRPVHGVGCTDISGIEEDLHGKLWISTQHGLSKYDPDTGQFTNFYAADGIGGNQFYDRSSCRVSDGTLAFGGTHGITYFWPLIEPLQRNFSLLFESLKVHNQLVHPSEDACIDRHISYNPDVRLKHEQNGFSISFAALDYCEYERLHYHYQLEGFDNYWIDAGSNREAYYANLPAGKYVFRVRATNSDNNVVEAENSIRVIVAPSPWLAWWACAIYAMLALVVVLVAFRVVWRIRKEQTAALIAEQEKAKEQRINRMNMSFFANISHEFRTPLTMISGPVTQLQEADEMTLENKRLLNIIQRNIRRMLRLVNQLLDFNKLENDTLKLQVRPVDVVIQLRNLSDIFRVTADEKGVVFRVNGLEDSLTVWADDDKVDKICFNLLSNAMKFTAEGGKVELNLDVITRDEASALFRLSEKDADSRYIKITVKDSGPGIPENQLQKIFERYYQLENQMRGVYNWGTGIGLYYAKALAEMHHGYLKAGNRTTGVGAVFTLILPVSENSYADYEKNTDLSDKSIHVKGSSVRYTERETTPDEARKTILVVDDDADVIHYMKELLSPYYNVLSRFDADSAYVLMKEEAPDIIVSDVVMPNKTGYELCRQIKANIQLSHIPVILLTAKATVNDQVEGLDCGADAYVTKPFEPQYLLALIASQLKNRENVRAILSEVTAVDHLDEDALSPQDNAFMTELYQLMEKELSNSELDITGMTGMMHISRTKFYYKVKGLTGENPSVFFKRYKLNRAAQLLSERKYTISEIADMTGFSTLSHFSTSFKKQFGVSPSEYVR